MKNCCQTLIYLLIVGILSLTTAHPHSTTEDEFSSEPTVPPNVNAIRNWFEEKCHKNGGPGAFEAVMKLPQLLKQCMRSVVDLDDLKIELEIAGRQNGISTVIKKYCKRIPEIEKCMSKMTDVIAACTDPEDKEGLKVNDKITNAVLEFVCHNDGERIDMFIAADGPVCVQSIQPRLGDCAEENFGKFFSDGRSEVFDLSEHPMMNLNQEKCLNLENFKTCAVATLEICHNPNTAIMAEELFAFVRKVTPCEELVNHSSIATPITEKPTDGSDSDMTMEELVKKNLLKQTEAAEAQVRAANAQEKAAHAQEQAARVLEQVGKSWLKKRPYA